MKMQKERKNNNLNKYSGSACIKTVNIIKKHYGNTCISYQQCLFNNARDFFPLSNRFNCNCWKEFVVLVSAFDQDNSRVVLFGSEFSICFLFYAWYFHKAYSIIAGVKLMDQKLGNNFCTGQVSFQDNSVSYSQKKVELNQTKYFTPYKYTQCSQSTVLMSPSRMVAFH